MPVSPRTHARTAVRTAWGGVRRGGGAPRRHLTPALPFPLFKNSVQVVFPKAGDEGPAVVPADVVLTLKQAGPTGGFRREGDDLVYTAHLSLAVRFLFLCCLCLCCVLFSRLARRGAARSKTVLVHLACCASGHLAAPAISAVACKSWANM